MKRSQINAIMLNADQFMHSCGFYLPPFAHWTLPTWRSRGEEINEILKNGLGWDITDFGQGDFEHLGLLLFTLRNGHPENWLKRSGKLYAEKIMLVEDRQVTPMHFHWNKMEDIINRGGGQLLIEVYQATPDDSLDRQVPIHISIDGNRQTLPAGSRIRLAPGESITLEPHCYHTFWGEGRVLVGEVSLVNDDQQDNHFLQPMGRFPDVEEDEPPLYLLTRDYGLFLKE
jgi:hypothetical protein